MKYTNEFKEKSQNELNFIDNLLNRLENEDI